MHRHPDGANGTRPEHSALARRKYGLLALDEPTGDPAAADPRDHGDGHEATMGTGGAYDRATEMGKKNGQRALLTCGQTEDSDMERLPPKLQRALNAYGYQGGEGGGPLTQQRALPACSQWREEDTPTRTRSPPSRSKEMEEGGIHLTRKRSPPACSQGIEGDTPTGYHAPPAHSNGTEERGVPPEQQRALLTQSL